MQEAIQINQTLREIFENVNQRTLRTLAGRYQGSREKISDLGPS